jgi:short-subunit dehydrogenase
MPRALVAGASQGIGRAIALALAARRYDLLLVARREAPLADVVAQAKRAQSAGGVVEGLAADLVDEDGQRRVVARAAGDASLPLDVLVFSAGTIARADVAEASLDDLDRQYAANLRMPYALTQALLPSLRAARGQIVFVNSSAALVARANAAQYAATQAGLRAFANSLRDEVNADGIRVTSIFPGRTATPRQERIHGWEGREYHPEALLQPEDVAAIVVAALELPRTAEVTEITIRSMAKT